MHPLPVSNHNVKDATAKYSAMQKGTVSDNKMLHACRSQAEKQGDLCTSEYQSLFAFDRMGMCA
eukprot:scaffold282813_cov24-Tisochrysis_lutea.AAC.2